MTETEALAYVMASARVLQLPMDDARARRVAGHLQRTAAMAQLLLDYQLDVEAEPAEVFCPAPLADSSRTPE